MRGGAVAPTWDSPIQVDRGDLTRFCTLPLVPRHPTTLLVAAVALLVAVAIWLAYAYLAFQPGSRIVRPANAPIYLGLIGAGCLLDPLVAVRCLRRRIGRVALTYVAVRVLLSAVGFLFFTLPFYGLALVAMSPASRSQRGGDPNEPHSYRPIWWGRLAGPVPVPVGARVCTFCGQPEDAAIHAVADEPEVP
jgi:hypothetical protein